jgi:hypothetical protein
LIVLILPDIDRLSRPGVYNPIHCIRPAPLLHLVCLLTTYF